MDLTSEFFTELREKAIRATRQMNSAFSQLAEELRPAIDALNAWGRSLTLNGHKNESISHYLERMERKERARQRYLRRIARR